jgi:hypothetical protein
LGEEVDLPSGDDVVDPDIVDPDLESPFEGAFVVDPAFVVTLVDDAVDKQHDFEL